MSSVTSYGCIFTSLGRKKKSQYRNRSYVQLPFILVDTTAVSGLKNITGFSAFHKLTLGKCGRELENEPPVAICNLNIIRASVTHL